MWNKPEKKYTCIIRMYSLYFLFVYILLGDAEILLRVENCARRLRVENCARRMRVKNCARMLRVHFVRAWATFRYESGINLK